MTYREFLEKVKAYGDEILDKEITVIVPLEYNGKTKQWSNTVVLVSELDSVDEEMERYIHKKTTCVSKGDVVLLSCLT